MGFLQCIVLFIFLSVLYGSRGASPASLSFPLTHRDAEDSVMKNQNAAISLLSQEEASAMSVEMKDFLEAGLSLKKRIKNQRHILKHKKKFRKSTDKKRRSRSKAKAFDEPGLLEGSFTYLMENVGDFYMEVGVGSPAQNLIFTLDTGSELTWTQCDPCQVCNDAGGPSFSFNRSSTYRRLSCSTPLCTQSLGFEGGCGNASRSCIFKLQYGDGSADAGYISVDNFHLGGTGGQQEFVFGCAVIDIDSVPIPVSGIMGLSAGPFSFTSQVLLGQFKKFAYCLPNRFTQLQSKGIITFGNYDVKESLTYTKLTPPLAPLGDLYYYVHLDAISVGGTRFDVSMHIDPLVGGGTIFDSGTAITHLVKPLYDVIIVELARQTAHLHPFASDEASSDLCYKIPMNASTLPNIPPISFYFGGVQTPYVLQSESVLYPAILLKNESAIIVCFAFASSPSGIPMNIIGNYQQQSYWIEYNLQTSSIGFAQVSNCPSSL